MHIDFIKKVLFNKNVPRISYLSLNTTAEQLNVKWLKRRQVVQSLFDRIPHILRLDLHNLLQQDLPFQNRARMSKLTGCDEYKFPRLVCIY